MVRRFLELARPHVRRRQLRITPEQLEAIAAQLYAELLAGGYTQVCEFHYLHNDVDGKPYADPLEMSLALVRAAQRTGIGLTLLPTLYMRSGFKRRWPARGPAPLRLHAGDRCCASPRGAAAKLAAMRASRRRRAAFAARRRCRRLREVWPPPRGRPARAHPHRRTAAGGGGLPAVHGQRPIEWLLEHAPSMRAGTWCTPRMPRRRTAALRRAAPPSCCAQHRGQPGRRRVRPAGLAAAGGRWSIGSDSHVTRSWPEELRLLEYSQRLALRQRNVAARVGA
jgi:formimidoylglutamate deiminase